MAGIYVCKYGGSSVSSPENIRQIGLITSDDPRRKVLVVSAPSGVTDDLINLCNCYDDRDNIMDSVIDRFRKAHPDADISELKSSLDRRLEKSCAPEIHDADVRSFGEYWSAKMIADKLGYRFIDASEILMVEGLKDDSVILPDSESRVKELLSGEGKFVVPGYYGADPQGHIGTFSRGGSDYTGSFIASALDADVYENFTDRTGVFTFDPGVVPEAQKIPMMTFKEMRDLAYSGAKIFHPRAILPLEKKLKEGHSVNVHIRSTMGFPDEGTFVMGERMSDASQPVVGLAYLEDFCSFDADMTGMNDSVGVIAEVTGLMRQRCISIDHATTGIDDMSVIVRKKQLKCEIGKVSDVKAGLMGVLGNDSYVRFQEHMGCLVVAGKGIKKQPTRTTYRLMGALLRADTDYVFMETGPSKSCVIVGIPSSRKEQAIRAVHEEFFG